MIESLKVNLSTSLSILALLLSTLSSVTTANDSFDFSASLVGFSQNLFVELFKSKGQNNIIFSPFSIQTCLAMVRMGADGETAVEMDQGLGFTGQTPESVADNYHTMLAKYEDGNMLKIANKVYVMEGFQLKGDYNELLSKKFFSAPVNIDFNNAEAAAKDINSWVESKTDNKIKDLISAQNLGADSRLVLVSAIYFKGEWEIPFDVSITQEQDFHMDETNTAKVQMMTNDDQYDYAKLSDLDATAVRLHYKDSALSMLIILPNSRSGFPALEDKLRKFQLPTLKDKFSTKRVEIYLPKFEVSFEIELTETLEQMGMKKMFGKADFGKMLETSDALQIASVVHKTFIAVTEFGTEAAGATGSYVAARSRPTVFQADHPFYYAIINEEFVPIFQGTVVKF